MLVGVVAATLCPPLAWAQDAPDAPGWRASLVGHPAGPVKLLAIDKDRQQLYVLEQKSPIALTQQFTCTTGEKPGDKYTEGDLRTPEGVYFTEKRLNGGLDYDLYGSTAHTLNFPNPIDRLRGKTGSGIWIHGRGHRIRPRETKGCVALNDDDMSRLDERLAPGTPVVIAKDVSWSRNFAASAPEDLEDKVRSWAYAWQGRSDDFFDFYEPQLFSKSSDLSFDRFKNHKQNLFRNLDWIQVSVHDLIILPGPDYWVTSFSQLYRSPSLVSEGVKRLYWVKDEAGELRIAGEEWINASLGLEKRFLVEMSQEMTAFVNRWREVWESGDVDDYLTFYDHNADQGSRRGVDSIREQKVDLWKAKKPEFVGIEDMTIEPHPKGVEIGFVQYYKDVTGYSDKGRKTMVLAPLGKTWRIVKEDWRSL